MIGRLVWFVGLAAIALLTAGLQLDLLAPRMPGLLPFLPEPLRYSSQTAITRAALAENNGTRALAEAERLVQRRPIPARNLVLLAVAQSQAGKPELAARTIQVAARRGWREPVAQEAMLRIALAAGDKAEAARRYAALFLSDRTPDPILIELGPAVLGEQGGAGQQALVQLLLQGDRWQSRFLRRGVKVMQPAAYAAIVAVTLQRGGTFDCAVLRQHVDLLKRRDAAASDQLAAATDRHCPAL